MSMQKLVDSLTSKPKDQRDAYTITEMKLAKKVYKKRIKSWGRFFDKWSVPEENENEQDFEVDQEEDWIVGGKSSDEEELEATEEEHTLDKNVSMTEHDKEVVMKTVHQVQDSINVTVDVCDDALCSVCGKRTYLPLVYHQNLVDAKFLKDVCCDECLIVASGHSECEKEICERCETIANEISNRDVIKEEFANGTLIVEED